MTLHTTTKHVSGFERTGWEMPRHLLIKLAWAAVAPALTTVVAVLC
jgi:hypothetical protein